MRDRTELSSNNANDSMTLLQYLTRTSNDTGNHRTDATASTRLFAGLNGCHPINCKELPWDEGFPSSHEWFLDTRTETHVFLARPKAPAVGSTNEAADIPHPPTKRQRVRSPRRPRRTRKNRCYVESSDESSSLE
jgi:hypothetical protein